MQDHIGEFACAKFSSCYRSKLRHKEVNMTDIDDVVKDDGEVTADTAKEQEVNPEQAEAADHLTGRENDAVQNGQDNLTEDTEVPVDAVYVQQEESKINKEPGKDAQGNCGADRMQGQVTNVDGTYGQNPNGYQPMPSSGFHGLSQETCGSLLSLAVSFLGIFCLLNVNIAFVASNMASRSLLMFNFVTIGAVSFLTALINTFLPGHRKAWILWVASVVAFAAAVLIQF